MVDADVKVAPQHNATPRVATFCLYAIAINAVLIQTIVDGDTSPFKTVVRAAVLGIAGLTLLVARTHVARWVVITAVISMGSMILGHNPDQLSYVFVLVLVPLLGQVDSRYMEKRFVFAAFLSLALILVFLYTGLTQNEIRDYRHRETFGVASVPFFMNVVYGAGVMLILYCRKYRPRGGLRACVAYLALATYFFIATDARGGYYALWVFVFLTFLMPALARSPIFQFAIALLPVGFLGFAFFIASRADNFTFNRLLSNRPYLYRNFLDGLGPRDFLLSKSVKQFDATFTETTFNGDITRGTFVDNSYLHLLVGGGVVVAAVFLIAYALAVLELFRRRMYPEVAMMTASAVYFNSESILVRIENVFVIYVWYLIVRYAVLPRNRLPLDQLADTTAPLLAQQERQSARARTRSARIQRDRYLSGR